MTQMRCRMMSMSCWISQGFDVLCFLLSLDSCPLSVPSLSVSVSLCQSLLPPRSSLHIQPLSSQLLPHAHPNGVSRCFHTTKATTSIIFSPFSFLITSSHLIATTSTIASNAHVDRSAIGDSTRISHHMLLISVAFQSVTALHTVGV